MNPVTGIALGRAGIGVLAVVNPALAAKAFQLDPETNPQLPYITRLFGVREIALGAATLLSRGAARRNLAVTGIVVDAGDAVSGYLALQEGTVNRRSAAALIAPAVGAVAAGIGGVVRG